jgi:hypothetical protein
MGRHRYHLVLPQLPFYLDEAQAIEVEGHLPRLTACT